MYKLETTEAFDALLTDGNVLIFKRSTRCPTSFIAFEAFRRFSEAHPAFQAAYVNVIEDREVSNHIAHITGIEHKSPQAILIRNGKVVWHDSHHNITEESLGQHCKEV